MAKKAKGGGAGGGGGGGIRLTGHPRAQRQISRAKGWGGLAAFGFVLYLSRQAGLPLPDAIGRALIGGMAGFLLAWGIAVTVWRHIALAELEDIRRSIVRARNEQAAREAITNEQRAAQQQAS